MSSADTAYYRQRANTERALALNSERHDIAEIHLELARLYQALVEDDDLRTGVPFAEAQDRPRMTVA